MGQQPQHTSSSGDFRSWSPGTAAYFEIVDFFAACSPIATASDASRCSSERWPILAAAALRLRRPCRSVHASCCSCDHLVGDINIRRTPEGSILSRTHRIVVALPTVR